MPIKNMYQQVKPKSIHRREKERERVGSRAHKSHRVLHAHEFMSI